MTYLDGLIFADMRGYVVSEYKSTMKAFSVSIGQRCAIALNHDLLNPNEETTALFHELGHCETGSFYNADSPVYVQARQENRADRWAIKKLIPQDELSAAIKNGYTEVWELASIFNVTEEMMKKAIHFYTCGNLCCDF